MTARASLRIAAALLLATSALAAPTGEEVIHGEVSFHQDGSVTVITASDGAIIHYDSFDIFASEVVLLEFLPALDTQKITEGLGAGLLVGDELLDLLAEPCLEVRVLAEDA